MAYRHTGVISHNVRKMKNQQQVHTHTYIEYLSRYDGNNNNSNKIDKKKSNENRRITSKLATC